MALKRIVLLSASSLFLLTGCGEGYELVKTNTMFPYGNQRTAGSGVAYVLAKMMPKKELKLESVARDVERDWKPDVLEILPTPELPPEPKAAPAMLPDPVVEPKKADQIFLDDGKK